MCSAPSGQEYRVAYLPAESDSGMFGGNSNWRGPIWMPVNALDHPGAAPVLRYYGDDFTVECPTGSGHQMTLLEVAEEIARRLARDLPARRERPAAGLRRHRQVPGRSALARLILFYEYFHGDNGAGLGASHQTGWTGVVARADAPVRGADTGDGAHVALDVRAVADAGEVTAAKTDGSRPPRPRTRSSTSSTPASTSRSGRACSGVRRPSTTSRTTELDAIAARGFDWVWLLSVWRTSPAGRQIALADAGLRREFEATLSDLRDEDVGGSGFAITGYEVSPALGGDAALTRVRERMAARGLRLMLDFVPNHMATDHPWVESHVDYFVSGSELDLLRAPGNYTRIERSEGDVVLAHGRDPYFAGWTDTLQLDYSNPAVCEAMTEELVRIARRCDGVRCDMAMLLLPDVFERTWGRHAQPFWAPAIAAAREAVPGFTLMAEVYWDLEWTMIQLGFDYAYDKRLYDRLVAGYARPVREHLWAGLDYQVHLARFLENHDEPRAAAVFPPDQHEAAALDHVPRARPTVPPRGPAGRTSSPHLAPPRTRAGRAHR